MEDGIMEWLLSMKYGNEQEREEKRRLEEQRQLMEAQAGMQQPQPQGGYANRSTMDQIQQRRMAEENALRY